MSWGGETFYIKSRDDATHVTVQTAATGDRSGAYTITRAYSGINAIQDWENGQQGDLVVGNRIEVGVAYKDGVFLPNAKTTIDGSTTDATHYMLLTVAPGQRHNGTAGTTGTANVIVDGASIPGAANNHLFQISDTDFRMEWLEIRNYFDGTPQGYGCPFQLMEGNAGNNLFSHLIIHDYTSNGGVRGAFNIYEDATIRNSIIYNGDVGLRTYSNTLLTLTLQNTTIYGMTGDGVSHIAGTLIVKNTISVGSSGGQDFDIDSATVDASSGYNLYSTVAGGVHPGTNNQYPAPANLDDLFVSIGSGSENLHLEPSGHAALNNGIDLSASFTDDIDGQTRPTGAGTWDIGADEVTDTSPPTPNPMTFATAPNNYSSTQIDMTATTASDPSTPIEYLFTFAACGSNGGTGGTSSSWQQGTSYSDSGLDANKCYGYTVTARDSVPNTGSASTPVSETYTSANVPGTPTLTNPTSSTLDLENDANGNPSSNPTTSFAVQVTYTSPNDSNWLNKWVDGSGNPSATAVWLNDAQLDALVLQGLTPSTTYRVQVKAKNQENDETSLSAYGQGTTSSGGGDTSPPTPNPMTWASAPANDSATQISMTSTTGSDATPPVEYLFTNDNSTCGANAGSGGTTSGWLVSTTSYSDTGLDPNKCYGYTVTARDSLLNTGTASGISTAYTSANVPGTPTLSNPSSSTLDLENGANGNPSSNPTTSFAVQVVTTNPNDSNWLNKWVNGSGNPSATAVWLTDAQLDALVLQGLTSSTTYGVKVKAKNQDGDETSLSAEGQGVTLAGNTGIAFDAASEGTTGSTAVGNLTVSHTVVSNTNGILIVGVNIFSTNATFPTVSTMTYNGAAMTFLAGVTDPGNPNPRIRSEMWYIKAPDIGTHDIYMTFSANLIAVAGGMSYTGVDQTIPLGSAVTASAYNGTAPTVNVSSAAGELVVDTVGIRQNSPGFNQTLTAGAGQTERYNNVSGTNSNSNVVGAGSEEAGAASVTMSWTALSSGNWAIVAAALKPASSTPTDLTQIHYRWRNDDGPEIDTGTGADGSVTISASKNIDTDVLGSNRSTYADGITTTVTANPTGTSISVTSTNGFAANDEILLINLRGALGDTADVGNYEFLEINSVTPPNTLNLKTTIQKSYDSTTWSNQRVIVQRVPQWTTVTVQSTGTLTANAWNGTSGGIIVFRANGTVTVDTGGKIGTPGLGYRGGAGGVADGGNNGESYDGQNGKGGADGSRGTLGGGSGQNYSTHDNTTGTRGGGGGGGRTGSAGVGAGAGAGGGYAGGGGGGGGGSDNAGNAGGGGWGGTTDTSAGGGGHGENDGTSGTGGDAGSPGNDGGVSVAKGGGLAGSGATTAQGGHSEDATDSPGGGGGGGGTYGIADLSKLFFGSGGGGGGDASAAGGNGQSGGGGGGIIYIIADTVHNNGIIQSTGADAGDTTNGDGPGGGGSGGSIMILAKTVDNSITEGITVLGGWGGDSDVNGNAGAGGGGGTGRIRIEASITGTGTTHPVASTSGTPSGATWAADEDIKLTGLAKGTPKRVRLEVSNEGGASSGGVTYQLQVAQTDTCSSGTYSTVPTDASGHWQIVGSSYITDGEATSNIASGLTDESTTFVAGQLKDAGNTTSSITLAGNTVHRDRVRGPGNDERYRRRELLFPSLQEQRRGSARHLRQVCGSDPDRRSSQSRPDPLPVAQRRWERGHRCRSFSCRCC